MQTATDNSTTPTHLEPEAPAAQLVYHHVLRFSLELTYTQEFYPTPRHKKATKRRVTDQQTFFVNYVQRREAPIVMVEPETTTTFVYRMYQGRLYREAKEKLDQSYTRPKRYRATTIEDVARVVAAQNSPWDSLDKNVTALEKHLERYISVEGRIYEQHDEPRYRIGYQSLEIEHGEPESTSEYVKSFNALEFEAAMKCCDPTLYGTDPYGYRARNINRILGKPNRDRQHRLPRIRVLDPQAVRLPSHEEYVERFETIQINRSVEDMKHHLRNHPKLRAKRILERLLELQNS